MSYAELKEWEAYFSYEPPMADRMELQFAWLLQMLSSFFWKEPGKVSDFMVCEKKRTKPKVKTISLLDKVKSFFKEEPKA